MWKVNKGTPPTTARQEPEVALTAWKHRYPLTHLPASKGWQRLIAGKAVDSNAYFPLYETAFNAQNAGNSQGELSAYREGTLGSMGTTNFVESNSGLGLLKAKVGIVRDILRSSLQLGEKIGLAIKVARLTSRIYVHSTCAIKSDDHVATELKKAIEVIAMAKGVQFIHAFTKNPIMMHINEKQGWKPLFRMKDGRVCYGKFLNGEKAA